MLPAAHERSIAIRIDFSDSGSREPLLRVSIGLFLLLFLTNAWFHQGSGWNQNARFGQIRAFVEDRNLWIDDFLLYTLELREDGSPEYRRVRVSDGSDRRQTRLPRANGLDIGDFEGHYYPNKPPGTLILAAPVYAALFAAERMLQLDPDDWWISSINLYLTTLLTVGLIGSLGGVVFLLLTTRLFRGSPLWSRLGGAMVLGFGTLWLPYSTMLFDHVIVGTCTLLAWLLLHDATDPLVTSRRGMRTFVAGLLCGFMVVLNYSAIVAVLGLGAYAAWRGRSLLSLVWWAAGGLGPGLVLAGFHYACFGDPFTLVHDHQFTIFRPTGARFLGMLNLPHPQIFAELLVLPYRGLFVTSPIMVLSIYGIIQMVRSKSTSADGVLVGGLAGLYLFVNASMVDAWHAGSSIGPRYMMPAVPLLAVAIVPAIIRLPRTAMVLAATSAVIILMVTAVDPQVAVEVRRPLADFYWPAARGETVVAGGYHMPGPVSVHTIGVPGAGAEILDGSTEVARWASFNLGEFLFPGSWMSLAPLLAGWLLVWFWLLRGAERGAGRGAVNSPVAPAAPAARAGTRTASSTGDSPGVGPS